MRHRIGYIFLAWVVAGAVSVATPVWAQDAGTSKEEASEEDAEETKKTTKNEGSPADTIRAARASLDIDRWEMKRKAEIPPLQQKTKPAFPWQEETFVYSCRINGAEAMRAALRTGELSDNDGKPYVPIGLNARSMGFFHNLYPVDDRADTFLNPEDFRPYRSEKYFHENGKRRSYTVDFTHAEHEVAVVKRRPDQVTTFSKQLPAQTHDMLSWLYDLRTREMEAGKRFEYYIYDGWKVTYLVLRVVGQEELYTPAGWFKSWKLEYDRHIVKTKARKKKAQKKSGGEQSPVTVSRKTTSEHSGQLWLSDDENHLPLRLTIGTSYGLGEVILLKYDRHEE